MSDGFTPEEGFTLGEGLTPPLEAVTEIIAILAQRGSGKTYCAAC